MASRQENINFQVKLDDELATLAFGKKLAQQIKSPAIIYLSGPLGAGKTTLVRGFLQELGCIDKVKSPTYTLVEHYELSTKTVFHFDFYRLKNPREVEFIGLEDYFAQTAIFLIEWPEKARGALPECDLSCYIVTQENGRKIQLEAHSEYGKTLLAKLVTAD